MDGHRRSKHSKLEIHTTVAKVCMGNAHAKLNSVAPSVSYNSALSHCKFLTAEESFSYNSVLFTTIAGHKYGAWLVTEKFVAGAWRNQTGSLSQDLTQLMTLHDRVDEWNQLDNEQCIRSYGTLSSMEYTYGNLLVVCENQNDDTFISTINGSTFEPLKWIPSKFPIAHAASWRVQGCSVAYCLAESFASQCTAKLYIIVLMVVIACNAIKVVAMLLCALRKFEPLATSGDAVTSFLTHADLQSASRGPLSAEEVQAAPQAICKTAGARKYLAKRFRWRNAADKGRRCFSRWQLFIYT